MTSADRDDVVGHQLDIIRLLDERFRLREDPERSSDLQLTHERLREELRLVREDQQTAPPDSEDTSPKR
jgi:hypothetical protein